MERINESISKLAFLHSQSQRDDTKCVTEVGIYLIVSVKFEIIDMLSWFDYSSSSSFFQYSKDTQ